MKKAELLACPFCGGEAEYKTGNHYISMCHYIRCKNCHSQTGAVDEGKYLQFGGKKDVVFTAETAKQYVINVWNLRTPSPEQVNCPSGAREATLECNKALTLDELREMDGDPVYLVCEPDADGEQMEMWALVEVDADVGEVYLTNNLGGRTEFSHPEDFDGVSIYRRPPEKGE